MKMMVRILMLSLLAMPAAAQEVLTLDNAVATALGHNTALRGSQEDVEAARWGKLNAATNFLPRVDLSSRYTRIDVETEQRANAAIDFIQQAAPLFGIPQSLMAEIRPFAYLDTYQTQFTVIQPIYNGGTEIVGLKAANAAEDRGEYKLEDTRQDVIARVKISYYTVLKAEELLALARESSARTSRYLETTRRREELGMRTRTDVLRWEVQLASDEGGTINAENFVAAARLQLNEVMGVDMHAQYTLEKLPVQDSVVAVAAVESPFHFAQNQSHPPEGEPVDGFLETHPAMRMAEASLRLADANVDRSWTGFQPRINAAFQYGWEQNNTLKLDGYRPWAFSLTVSLPIFNGFGDYTNLQKAQADQRSAEAQVETFRRTLQLQETNAQLNIRAARKRMEVASKGQEEALEVLASVTRRYESGGASNVDLIDVQTAYTSAKTSYITAVYDYAIANVQLDRSRGTVAQ